MVSWLGQPGPRLRTSTAEEHRCAQGDAWMRLRMCNILDLASDVIGAAAVTQ